MKEFKRTDLSEMLIHFTKGKSDKVAFDILYSILIDKCIIASEINNSKKSIVCFTETPLNIIVEHGFVNYTDYNVYRKFGIMFYKKDIYKITNGRPALYLEKDCIEKLPDDLEWRSTLFEPKFEYDEFPKKGSTDFSWEREWRVKDDVFLDDFDGDYFVLVPNEFYKKELEDKINEYFTDKYQDCNEHNPRYFKVMEYNYFEQTYIEVEVENEDNCECNVFDPEDNTPKILLLDKIKKNN